MAKDARRQVPPSIIYFCCDRGDTIGVDVNDDDERANIVCPYHYGAVMRQILRTRPTA